jgi:signal transduction histidine kinase
VARTLSRMVDHFTTEPVDRHNRELAEHLHDGPLQTLLAARLQLDEVRERHPDPALDVLQTALHEAAAGLRSTVSELHPQVLAQLGLSRQYENWCGSMKFAATV